MVRVIVADSTAKVRFALGVMLRQRAGVELVGEAIDAQDLLKQVREMTPDIVLLDWKLRGPPAQDTLGAVRACCPGTYLIVLSYRPESRAEAMAAGAHAFVSKVDPPDRLVAAIEAALCP
jgi:DNA-binding NarL/FixJ family response regulator